MENNNNNFFEDLTDQFAADDIAANKSIAAVACIPALFWIPLINNSSKESAFAKFYANQGLILLILGIVLGIVNGILGAIFGNLGAFGRVLGGLINLVCSLTPFACFLYEIIAAVNGKAKPIPLVGKLITVFQ